MIPWRWLNVHSPVPLNKYVMIVGVKAAVIINGQLLWVVIREKLEDDPELWTEELRICYGTFMESVWHTSDVAVSIARGSHRAFAFKAQAYLVYLKSIVLCGIGIVIMGSCVRFVSPAVSFLVEGTWNFGAICCSQHHVSHLIWHIIVSQ